ncbi:glycosyltransferase family A protein [uncultured Microbacterium sp.]|uniref:glycosyltransferase family 2 protein n=1 Tax=uncultured Microbacterium sp. TaxID=191216 RepID=UPI0026256592|nr:glycosyltransferase family A protein [uncultured Microbacterium sp.]
MTGQAASSSPSSDVHASSTRTSDSPADVAIIVRTKDRPDILRRALSSILDQTFPRWEAVIVNDGGDPRTIELLVGEHADRAAGRIRIEHHSSPRGRWGAANAGVTATTAPLIVLHDDDDSWDPEFLAETSGYLRTHPEEHAVIARTEVILEEPRAEGLVETGRYLLEDHNAEVLLTELLQFNRFVPISFLYRRELHEHLGLYDASLPAAGDWAFNLATVALRPIAYVSDRPLAYWHQRPTVRGVEGNSVHANDADHRFADRSFRDKQLRAYVQASGLGLPLYLTEGARVEESAASARAEAIHARLDEVMQSLRSMHERMDRLEHDLSRTIDTRVRGWVWRQKQRLRRR